MALRPAGDPPSLGGELPLLVMQRVGVALPHLDDIPLGAPTDGDGSIGWRVLGMGHRIFLSG